jgi:hypothetical protein
VTCKHFRTTETVLTMSSFKRDKKEEEDGLYTTPEPNSYLTSCFRGRQPFPEHRENHGPPGGARLQRHHRESQKMYPHPHQTTLSFEPGKPQSAPHLHYHVFTRRGNNWGPRRPPTRFSR